MTLSSRLLRTCAWMLPMLPGALGTLRGQVPPPYSCSTAAVPPAVRSEGLSEAVADIFLNCSGGHGISGLVGNLQVFLNTNITSRLVTGSTTEAVLVSADGQVKLSGQQAAANSVLFPAVQFAPSGVTSSSRAFQILFLRANASALGSGSAAPTSIIAFLATSGPTAIPINNPQLTVAFGLPGLQAAANEQTLYQCLDMNRQTSQQARNKIVLQYNEQYADAFKLAGVGAAATRLFAALTDVPSGATIWASTRSIAGPAQARMVFADANGAGGSDFVTGSAFFGGEYTQLAVIGGASVAFWEITQSSPSQNETIAFEFVVAYPPSSVAPGSVTVKMGFAPFSDVSTMSQTAPIPRFVGGSSESTMFTISSVCPSFSVTPPSLTFNAVSGGPAPASQNLSVNSNPQLVGFDSIPASFALGWGVTNGSGVTSQSTTVFVNPTTAAAGTYNTNVTFYWGGAPVVIPVTVNVTSNISVTVSPPTATLEQGQSQQFTASVSGTANQSVTWAVTSGPGTINSNGVYTTPASVTFQQTATVRATSAADTTKFGTATVTLNPTIGVSVSPPTATLQQGQTQQFTATVSGSLNQSVTWSVTSGPGTINANGVYTAPASVALQQSATVRATSVADNTKFGSATVTLNPTVGVTVSPPSATLQQGQTQQFSATVSGTLNQSVTWSVTSGPGTINSSGVYSAPASVAFQQSATVRATSVADNTKFGTATVTLNATVGVVVSPPSATLQQGQSQQFAATVSGTSNQSVTWSVISGPGTITSNGVYTAPPTVLFQQTATVRAIPAADSSMAATATITLQALSCTSSLSSTSASFGSGASNGSVNVNTPAGCPWTAEGNAAWVTITSGGSGSGPAVVSFAVAANNAGLARTAILTIAGSPFTVTQAGQGCIAGLDPGRASFSSAPASASVALAMSFPDCPWSAASNVPWASIASARSGVGSATVRYSLDANPASTSRSGTLNIAGLNFQVSQSSGDCSIITLSDASQSFAASGGSGNVMVSAPAGCAYSATSNAPSFLNVTSGGSSSGPAAIGFNVLPNTGNLPRTGTLTIAGRLYTVNQAADSTPTLSCAVSNVGSPAPVRSLGRAELLSDLDLSCSGRTGGAAFSADIVVTLNANLTNRITIPASEIVDAALTISGGGEIAGRVEGVNAVRFSAVPFSSGEPTVAFALRISKLRADLSLLGTASSQQGTAVTATLTILAPVAVPIQNGTQTIGVSRAALAFTRGTTRNGTNAAEKIVPVIFQEGFPDSFRTREGEAGGSAADTATRLRLHIGNVPVTAQVFAPAATINNIARLVSANADGIGGSPVAGSPRAGGTYAPVPVSGGLGVAVWEVIVASVQSIEGIEFPLLIENATTSEIDQLRLDATLAPLNDVAISSSTAPIPRFADPSRTASLVNLRITGAAQSAGNRPIAMRAPVAVGSTVTFSFLVTNDSDQTAGNVVIRDNLPAALTNPICTASQGNCAVSGPQIRATIGAMAPGAQTTVNVTATVGGVGNCPNCVSDGSILQNSATAGSDQSDPDLTNNTAVTEAEVDTPCQFTLSRAAVTAAGSGSSIRFDVITGPACDWNVPASEGGLGFSPSGALRGSATLNVSVPANPGGAQRTLQANIQGQAFTVVQAGQGCTFALNAPTSLPNTGGAFQLQIQTGCSWQVVAGPEWLRLTTQTTGSGNGAAGFTAQANPSVIARSGFLEVAGQTLQLTQAPASVAGPVCTFTLSTSLVNLPIAGGAASVNVTTGAGCLWNATASDTWITISGGSAGSGSGAVTFSASTNAGAPRNGTVTIGGQAASVAQSGIGAPGLRFVPLDPCRVMETRAEYNFRGRTGAFGPPFLRSGETRTLVLSQSNVCQIPAAAKAYVVNVTLVPRGPADFVTVWPGGEPRPDVWTVRSPDAQIVANSAIVKAGNGAIQVYSSNDADVLIDISGYFTDSGQISNLVYYPLTPCRVIDTRLEYRSPPGPFGPPTMNARETRRFRFPATPYCQVPPNAAAYSVTLTVVPSTVLPFLTAWPAGGVQPVDVSSINSPAGRVLANSVIVPASSDGSIDVFAFDRTDFLVDVNGYFAADNGQGLFYFPVTQCRVSDSRNAAGTFGGPIFGDEAARTIPIPTSGCAGIPASAKGYALNATALPGGSPMPFLTLWPTGQSRPNASILNAFQGQVVTNSAIVPAGANGSIDVFAFRRTHIALEISGYFGR